MSESASAYFQGSGEKCVRIHLTDFRPFFSRESLPKIAGFSLLAMERRLCLLAQVHTLTSRNVKLMK